MTDALVDIAGNLLLIIGSLVVIAASVALVVLLVAWCIAGALAALEWWADR